MPDYRRAKLTGGTFFFTVVTFNHLPILTGEAARKWLHDAWMDTRKRFLFQTEAVVLLPDHLHTIWTLPEGDANFSVRWKEIKRLFTKSYLQQIGPGDYRNEARQKRGEAAIRQRRFWEHTLRDEADLNRLLDTIHYNPVKHGLVKRVCDWPWSSFHRYVKTGFYTLDWEKEMGVELDAMAGLE